MSAYNYTSNFNKAFEIIMQNEGGYNNDPADAGGETYRGIARKFFPNWSGWKIIDTIKKTRTIKNEEIIKDPALNELVKQYYFDNKWKNYSLDKIIPQADAVLMADMVTNHGQGAAQINKGLIKAGFNVAQQNKIGTDTIAVVNSNAKKAYDAMAAQRKVYIQYLLDSGQVAQKFGNGLLARAEKFIKNTFGLSFAAATAGGIALIIMIAGVFF